jgi:hypothetical protein
VIRAPSPLVVAAVVAAIAVPVAALLVARPDEPSPARLSHADAAAARDVVRRAQGLVRASAEALGYRLRVEGPRPGLRAQTDTGARTVTLFVAPHAAAHRVAHDLAHELGHAADASRLSAAQRAEYLRKRGVSRADWWPGDDVSDYRSGAGDFAEVFALCHAASPEFRSRLAGRPQDPCRLLPKETRIAEGAGGRA